VKKKKVWLISDEAYEDFIYGDAVHYSPTGDNVINVWSFSKGYGMAGWRVGYFCYPEKLGDGIDKCQDTVPINTAKFSQMLAVNVLNLVGKKWVDEKVSDLTKQREVVWNALQVVRDNGGKVVKTQGAFYFWVELPKSLAEKKSDYEVVEYLAKEWKVWVLTGEGFGRKGSLRVSYGNLEIEDSKFASARLQKGLESLLTSSN